MKNKSMWIYIMGLVSGLVLIPIIEELLPVICSWFEVLKIPPSRIISRWNSEMNAEVESDEQTVAIGFQAPSYEDEVCDDYDC